MAPWRCLMLLPGLGHVLPLCQGIPRIWIMLVTLRSRETANCVRKAQWRDLRRQEWQSGRSEKVMLLANRWKGGPCLKTYQHPAAGKGQEILLAWWDLCYWHLEEKLVLNQFVWSIAVIGQKLKLLLDHCANPNILSSQSFLCCNNTHARICLQPQLRGWSVYFRHPTLAWHSWIPGI